MHYIMIWQGIFKKLSLLEKKWFLQYIREQIPTNLENTKTSFSSTSSIYLLFFRNYKNHLLF
jgi:hypothetical protein